MQAAVGHPLTVYGKGGQTRGFLDIRDTVRLTVKQGNSRSPQDSRQHASRSVHLRAGHGQVCIWGIWPL